MSATSVNLPPACISSSTLSLAKSPSRSESDEFKHLSARASAPECFESILLSEEANRTPVQSKSGPVPSNYSFGTDDDESLSPAGPESPRENPEDLVEYVKPRSWVVALKGRELLPQNEIIE